MAAQRIDAHFVCGGKYHDIDFARLEILKILGDHANIRVTVDSDYRNTAALERADFLISYTCEVIPDEDGQHALDRFLSAGKRWFALHGTNSILHYRKGAGWEAPRTAPLFMKMLGSQFVAHPPIQPYEVRISDPEHPLVSGIEAFQATDELYLCEMLDEVEILLETEWSGTTPGFVEHDWSAGRLRPVMYLRNWNKGEVLYLTLGHARGHFDMQPLMDEYPETERGSWPTPEFHALLRRGIRWAAREL
jgi:type 1 glutamine amidotransferase